MIAPPLPDLLRHVAERPPAARAEPEGFGPPGVRVRAVLADLLETLCGELPDADLLAAFDPADRSARERNRLRWLLAAAHLLWHPALRASARDRSALRKLLVQELAALAAACSADRLDAEEERREELVRRVLRALGATLPGESPNEEKDRFRQVDSVERRRVEAAAAEREKRAREVREALARKAAEEAAAKASRE